MPPSRISHPLFAALLVWLSMGSGCAVMHAAQLGEIDSAAVLNNQQFEIRVSELGLSLDDAAAIAEAVAEQYGRGEEAGGIGDIIALFQMGPKTGNPVFRENYTDHIGTLLAQECPSGNITGLMAIRETAQYPIVSGEIVRLIGYCAKD